MSASFRPNRAGYRELLTSAQLYPALSSVANRVAERARANSRVESAQSAAEHNRAAGKFRNSIHVERHRSPSRVVARVVADCEGATPIEHRDRPLGRAAS